MDSALSSLAQYETVIELGIKQFYEVGSALYAIREAELYRQVGYVSFTDYCLRRWQFGDKRAFHLIASADVVRSLTVTNVTSLPANEAQTRPLVSLPDEWRGTAWQIANDVASELNITVTGALVKRTVDTVKEVMTTKAIMLGDEQVSLQDLIRGQVTSDHLEARARQAQHISDQTQSVKVASTEAVWNGITFDYDFNQLVVGYTYRLVVYQKRELPV